MQSVLRLDEIDGAMVPVVGGKAANLGALVGAGFPVPRGFCLTTQAYREVAGLRLVGLSDELTRARGDAARVVAAQARELIASAPVPDSLAAEISGHYRRLGSPPVAVRSSATAEDLEFASFAGQQDTYLNVVGATAVLEAVRRCWASLWTDRAVSYRNSLGIAPDEVALAVVVQEMVASAAAGVMFTANPVTGSRSQTVVDAGPGLGESVVSGAVNPDHFVVDTAGSTVLERRAGDKRVLIRGLAGGGTERVERADSTAEQAITDRQVLDLAVLGRRVQEHYGAPQDIEWAIDGDGTLWLTQSRPITTLFPLPPVSAAGPPPRILMCLTLAQGLTRPITPMGLAAFRLIASSVATAAGSPPADPLRGPRPYNEVAQRVFVDFTAAINNPIGRRVALAVFGVMEARAAAVIRTLVADRRFAVASGSRLAALRPVARVLLKVRVPQRVLLAAVSPARALRAVDELERTTREGLAGPLGPTGGGELTGANKRTGGAELTGANKRTGTEERTGGEELTGAERLDRVEQDLGQVFWHMPTVVAYPLAGFGLLALARRLLGGLAQPGDLQTVLRGLPHNVTTEMDLALWQLSAEIGADPDSREAFAASSTTSSTADLTAHYARGALPTVAQLGLARFLDGYGHRAIAEIDLGMPRWSDDPSHLLGVLSNYLLHDDPALAADAQFRAGNAAAEAMVETLVARSRERSRARAVVVAFCLRRARQLAGLREAPKNLLVLALSGIRRQLRDVGVELVAEGGLAEADDIFFVDLTEARSGLAGTDLTALVADRKEAYAAELQRRHIPRIVLSDGTEPEAVGGGVEHPDGALVGSPASAGIVTARARVILDPVGAHLEPGEILVAPSTDPGWTPLFLTAGGLVMEMGGSNSHGAVVAREYGIPAVVGVPEATSLISTGQEVTVDGAAGLVLAR